MQDVSNDNRVLSLVAQSGIRNMLVTLLDQLQRCQKSLNEFLEVCSCLVETWGAFLWSKSKSGFRIQKWILFSLPLGKSKRGFRIHWTHSEEGFNRFNPNPDFLHLKSKCSIGNGFEKSTCGQHGSANNMKGLTSKIKPRNKYNCKFELHVSLEV